MNYIKKLIIAMLCIFLVSGCGLFLAREWIKDWGKPQPSASPSGSAKPTTASGKPTATPATSAKPTASPTK